MTDQARLYEINKDEMFDVGRMFNPRYTREEFERDWADFQEMKRRVALQ